MSKSKEELVANMALLALEAFKTYWAIQARLEAVSRGEAPKLDDLPQFEERTRERLDALRAKIKAFQEDEEK